MRGVAVIGPPPPEGGPSRVRRCRTRPCEGEGRDVWEFRGRAQSDLHRFIDVSVPYRYLERIELPDGRSGTGPCSTGRRGDRSLGMHPPAPSGSGGSVAHAVPIVVPAVMLVYRHGIHVLLDPRRLSPSRWSTRGTCGASVRAAHYVGWGDLGGIYTAGTGVVSVPRHGHAPCPVGDAERGTPSDRVHTGCHPRAPDGVLLVLPVELLLASTVVFAADALAQDLGVSRARRAWSVPADRRSWRGRPRVLWGHAEDALAMTLATLRDAGRVGGPMGADRLALRIGDRDPAAGRPCDTALPGGLAAGAEAPDRRPMRRTVRVPRRSCVPRQSVGNLSVTRPAAHTAGHEPRDALGGPGARGRHRVRSTSTSRRGVPSVLRGGFSSTTVVHHAVANGVSGAPAGRSVLLALALLAVLRVATPPATGPAPVDRCSRAGSPLPVRGGDDPVLRGATTDPAWSSWPLERALGASCSPGWSQSACRRTPTSMSDRGHGGSPSWAV